MKIRLAKIIIPDTFEVVKNEFTAYDPEFVQMENVDFDYLYEDLLQLSHKRNDLIIDLGWYNSSSDNKIGEFKIFVVKNEDWSKPIRIETSISQKRISEKLKDLLNEFI